MKFYDIRDTIKKFPNATYYLIWGERSNGKTYGALNQALDDYAVDSSEFVYLRRYDLDVQAGKLTQLFSAHKKNGELSGRFEFDDIDYRSGVFTLCKREGGKVIKDDKPIGYGMSLTSMEHFKSLSYPNIRNIIFDEFMSRTGYLTGEFELFQNVISTLVRQRDDVRIIMLANTVNKSNPYFTQMGLYHAREQKIGSVEQYEYTYSSGSKMQVICEYTESTKGGKKSDKYFAFDSPAAKMITEGGWEVGLYPRTPYKITRDMVVQRFLIEYEGQYLNCAYVVNDRDVFVEIRPKRGPIKREDDIIYGTSPSPSYNIRTCLTKQDDPLSKAIQSLIKKNKVFFANNEVGEIFRNYLRWSENYNLKNI